MNAPSRPLPSHPFRPAAWPRRALIAAIRGYRLLLSPILPPSCRYTPTCSEYALEAVTRFGAARGSWKALKRVLRCHPFHPGGYDPVEPD